VSATPTLSRAAWNRAHLDLRSDEVLAQILDRGDLASWQLLYATARTDHCLRGRIVALVRTVPLPLPRFWLAALASLGEDVDFDAPAPDYFRNTSF
jgi:hypothetical protein